MKRSTILAIMEGTEQSLNESLIFWKATNDIERAGSRFTTEEYTTQTHEFYDGDIPFDIPSGSVVKPYTSWYKGNDVVIGIEVRNSYKRFVDEITDYDVQSIVRELIAKEVSKVIGYGIGGYSVDCKLTKLYLEEKLTWEEYCETIGGSC